jgi:hypothetical protein
VISRDVLHVYDEDGTEVARIQTLRLEETMLMARH